MKYTENASRIFLGILVMSCGILIIVLWDPTNYLEQILTKLPLLKIFAPYYYFYLKIIGGFLSIGGFLVIFEISFGIICLIVGFIMMGITYDNPMLGNASEIVSKLIYITSYFIVVIALSTVIQTSKTKRNDLNKNIDSANTNHNKQKTD